MRLPTTEASGKPNRRRTDRSEKRKDKSRNMTGNAKIALNPLPWVLTAKGFELSVPVLRQAFSEIATTPFQAVQADPPAGMTAAQYRTLLSEYGLSPAPGYYSALFHELPSGQIIESAKRHAAMQAELGNTEVFIAAGSAGSEWTAPQ